MEIDWYNSTWAFIIYCIGTYMGYRFGNRAVLDVIESTIDQLRRGGYIKVKYDPKDKDNYELIKLEGNDGR